MIALMYAGVLSLRISMFECIARAVARPIAFGAASVARFSSAERRDCASGALSPPHRSPRVRFCTSFFPRSSNIITLLR